MDHVQPWTVEEHREFDLAGAIGDEAERMRLPDIARGGSRPSAPRLFDLETRARQNAEINIRNESLKRGILTMAADSGEKKMAEFLKTLGFERVRFERATPPSGLR